MKKDTTCCFNNNYNYPLSIAVFGLIGVDSNVVQQENRIVNLIDENENNSSINITNGINTFYINNIVQSSSNDQKTVFNDMINMIIVNILHHLFLMVLKKLYQIVQRYQQLHLIPKLLVIEVDLVIL